MGNDNQALFIKTHDLSELKKKYDMLLATLKKMSSDLKRLIDGSQLILHEKPVLPHEVPDEHTKLVVKLVEVNEAAVKYNVLFAQAITNKKMIEEVGKLGLPQELKLKTLNLWKNEVVNF